MLRSRAPSTRPAPGPVSIRRFGRLTGSAHVPRFRLISGLERTGSRTAPATCPRCRRHRRVKPSRSAFAGGVRSVGTRKSESLEMRRDPVAKTLSLRAQLKQPLKIVERPRGHRFSPAAGLPWIAVRLQERCEHFFLHPRVGASVLPTTGQVVPEADAGVDLDLRLCRTAEERNVSWIGDPLPVAPSRHRAQGRCRGRERTTRGRRIRSCREARHEWPAARARSREGAVWAPPLSWPWVSPRSPSTSWPKASGCTRSISDLPG